MAWRCRSTCNSSNVAGASPGESNYPCTSKCRGCNDLDCFVQAWRPHEYFNEADKDGKGSVEVYISYVHSAFTAAGRISLTSAILYIFCYLTCLNIFNYHTYKNGILFC